jgi:hypothetical protein
VVCVCWCVWYVGERGECGWGVILEMDVFVGMCVCVYGCECVGVIV